MATSKLPTIGEEHAAVLKTSLRKLTFAPLVGARGLPELIGVHAPPKSIYTAPQDNVLLRTIDILKKSGRVYAYGDDVVCEMGSLNGEGQSLFHFRLGRQVEAGAECWLANVFTCIDGPITFPPPRWFVRSLFTSDLLDGRLPRIRMYAARPVFDMDYQLCSPGWHPKSGVLVHGPHVEPVFPAPADTGLPALGRLPLHLRTFLGGFCFRSDADLANALAMFITGLLANHFVREPKGLFLVDGNQPGLGKTLLVRCLGQVLDGADPLLVPLLANDVELEKRICATLRGRWQSLVFIDNAKAAGGRVISSPTIEANSVAAEASFRILGTSEIYIRQNDLLWVITMNDTRVSPDLASRGVPVRLAYEGRPEARTFAGPQPLAYAREHRLEILGELAGMVLQWNQADRPSGVQTHRSHVWAAILGGILQVAGFPEFLINAGEAAAAFDVQMDELGALAEAAVVHDGPFIEIPCLAEQSDAIQPGDKLLPSDWLPIFKRAGILAETLTDLVSKHAKSIRAGQFLSPNVGRTVPIQANRRSGQATLRVEFANRAKGKRYFFEVTWDAPAVDGKLEAEPTTKPTGPPKPALKSHPPTPSAAKPPAPGVSRPGNDEPWE